MPEYDFKTLSPSDFELLVRDLLAEEYGWRLEAFGRGKDGGVDLRARTNGKKVVVQCKHYAGSTFADLRSASRKELSKMDKELPGRYVFVTSQDLSRTQKDTLVDDLSKWITDPADVLTMRDLNSLLARHPKVERQHFKLWLASTEVLERIVHKGLWERSEALMEDIRDRVKLYVRSPGFKRATDRLDSNHVVVLTGAPGVGKSMLAEMLLLTHWHDGWEVVAISSNIDEGWDAYRRNERQIFFYDDFLGQTDISERATKNEDSRITRFMERVSQDSSKRLVMTTRSQILRQAELAREPIARGNFQLRECVIEVSDYGIVERARILYNHLYFSSLPREVVRDYATGKLYWQVVNHPNFSPRIIEQVLKQGIQSGEQLARTLVSTFDRPIELWGTMFTTVLSEVAQRIVLTLVTFPPEGVAVDTLRQIVRRNASPIQLTHALRALEDTFVRITTPPAHNHPPLITYANPSVRDFVLATLDDEPECALQLVNQAGQLRQILTLMEYAASSAGRGQKFPVLAQSISDNQAIVAKRINRLATDAIEEANAKKHPKWQVHSTAIRSFAGILGPARTLLRQEWPNLLERALTLNREYGSEYGHADTLGILTQAVIAQACDQFEGGYEQVKQLAYDWGRSLTSIDEIESFIEFAKENEQKINRHFDLRQILRDSVEVALEEEIEAISSNRQDEEADNQWLDQIERIATEIGIEENLRRAIQSERSSIAEHYEDIENIEPPRYNSTYATPRGTIGGRDRSYVDDIFRQLT